VQNPGPSPFIDLPKFPDPGLSAETLNDTRLLRFSPFKQFFKAASGTMRMEAFELGPRRAVAVRLPNNGRAARSHFFVGRMLMAPRTKYRLPPFTKRSAWISYRLKQSTQIEEMQITFKLKVPRHPFPQRLRRLEAEFLLEPLPRHPRDFAKAFPPIHETTESVNRWWQHHSTIRMESPR
jgi:hypothetical protein